MIRRKLTLKRVDPWAVLKLGAVVNGALFIVGLLGFWILWAAIGQLGIIDKFCGSVGTIVLDSQECGISGASVFRTVFFLGILGGIVQTGLYVCGAFLYNLIADLTGGLEFSFLDDAVEVGGYGATPVPGAAWRAEAGAAGTAWSSQGGGSSPSAWWSGVPGHDEAASGTPYGQAPTAEPAPNQGAAPGGVQYQPDDSQAPAPRSSAPRRALWDDSPR